ncbi:hypothetical protein ACIKTA_06890 [Hansschlegelia beijingensis]
MSTRRTTKKPRTVQPSLGPSEAIALLQSDIERARAAPVTATGLVRRQLQGEIDVAEWTIARLERQVG